MTRGVAVYKEGSDTQVHAHASRSEDRPRRGIPKLQSAAAVAAKAYGCSAADTDEQKGIGSVGGDRSGAAGSQPHAGIKVQVPVEKVKNLAVGGNMNAVVKDRSSVVTYFEDGGDAL